MRPNDQQHEPGGIEKFKRNLNMARFICDALATTGHAFLHRRFGERYLGLQAMIGAGLILLVMAFGAPHDPVPLFLFFWAYLLMLLASRVECWRARMTGVVRHSRYNGEPRLSRFFPRLDELTIKRRVEPVLVGLLGFVVLGVNQPLGCYLILVAGAMGVSVAQILAYERLKAVDAVDAIIDARQHAERVRERGGRFLN